MAIFRAALKNIFPDKLSVKTVETAEKTVFQISGKALPFNAVSEIGLPIELNSGAGT